MSTETARRGRATIRDVAARAGVSHQTVSRFLRADPTISPALRERIEAAVEALDYRPNVVARAMRGRRTGRLALLLPSGEAISSLEILAGATGVVEDSGYALEALTIGGPPAARAQRVVDLLDSGLFEAVAGLTALEVEPERLVALRTPVILAPSYDSHMRSVGELADGSRIADLVSGLADLGHTTFVHLAGDLEHASAVSRREVYLETIASLGLHSYGVIECGWSPERAGDAVGALPGAAGVTAVIAANDKLAAGAIRGAARRGWTVPGDLSITGWDDNELSSVMMPSLSTVSVDHARLGRRIARDLLALVDASPAAPPDDEEPITRIVWRESTGRAPVRPAG
ncbi:LacI family DNA-binding transcriptional regulator [Demequina sp. SYSU T00039]|uniref:LacI family DNA-binding transcriptional regulator n=1 Tax=Demequina lignilytica TaxID=3051663 RepID=A0AAW7M6T4_9MICO|nr:MULTISPECIES: LacI family DNA-binding transcriptional regulator [unclassified Demequina]MDN4478560.1 LacI family DNA-binding transcriptional regulator [Demequina sp. SYSU T00039-1]MDN4486933.1 LacI family DNA-binding transcriptional regulator [Demequina sp. SYSU T00039]